MPKISLVSFVTIFIVLGCSICGTGEPITESPCEIKNLMIDESMFRDGWYQQGLPSERSAPVRWGIEKLGVSFISQKDGVALQFVHQGRNPEYAEKGYFDLVDSWFDSEEDATAWYIPPEFNYESTVANHYRFGCRTYKLSGVESCQLVGQYEMYVTRFHTFMSPIMTYDDLERVLRAIDTKMTQCLGM